MTSKIRDIVDAVFSLTIINRIQSELTEGDADIESLFNSLYSVGAFLLTTSMAFLLALFLIANVITSNPAIDEFVLSLISNLPYLLVATYIVILILKELIKNIGNANPPMETLGEWIYRQLSGDDDVSRGEEIQSNSLVFKLIILMLTSLNFVVLYFYRTNLIISQIPSYTGNPVIILYWALIVALDVGYFGLLLVTIGQTHLAYRP